MKKVLKEIYNLDTSIYESSFLHKIVQDRLRVNHIISEKNYLNYLNENMDEIKALKKALNNNFSKFFRNKLTFSYLEQVILPELIQQKTKLKQKEIRIWSAACASGQEAYSLAILCNELSKSQQTNIRFNIFATDISEGEIKKAQKGIYAEQALNNITMKRIKENFELKNAVFSINKEIKEYVEFSTFNLLDVNNDSPPVSIFGSFDLIFCSNLLFYYNAKIQKQMLNKVDANLLPGGYLVIGEAEKNSIKREKSYTHIFNTSILRKSNSK
ncbi:MAG: hypothetical protein COC22_00655 [Flavobacteriaceae bacterium]|nr:MAG: hypothetical protein COC22_00655 [Flavobacteriaceae bacterium]